MYATANFCENLNALRTARHLSIEEFSKELGIPKSTLQSVLKEGETSLHTAIRISVATGIPLSALLEDPISPAELKALDGYLAFLGWFSGLEPERQRMVADAISVILEALKKS